VTARQKDLLLAIDVGTGSVRAALFHRSGRMLGLSARQHDQFVPRFGWAEQRPADWWDGAIESIRRVLETTESASHRVSAIAACGQMHGVVLIDDDGQLVLDSVQLWNDKRPSEDVSAFVAAHDVDALWTIAANPPSVAWPGFKLRWIARHRPEALSRAASLLMPKDYVNFQLTGALGMDESDASCTYLWDARTGDWSPELTRCLGIDVGLLPRVRAAHVLLSRIRLFDQRLSV
jgi:xylulokinase